MTSSAAPVPRLVALRSHDFRLLWIGMLVSTTGSQMQLAAVNWHIYQLLRDTTYTVSIFGAQIELSAAALGLGTLGLVLILPIISFGIIGGVMADSYNRRTLMMFTQSTAAVLAGILAILTLTGHDTLGAIYLLSAGISATIAFDNPARQSLVPNLVPREHLANAVSLNTLMFQTATIIGPSIAGLMIGRFNIGLVYAINSVSFVMVLIALILMHYRGSAAPTKVDVSWRSLTEGLRYTYNSRIIWGTMLLDFFATFFASARTMLPIIAGTILNIGPVGYGLLLSAQPVGALLAGTVLTLRKEIEKQGVVLLVSVVIYGIATIFFGLSTTFALSFLFMALVGAGDTVSTVIRGTLRQLLTPDHLRGRMTGVNMIFFMGGPQLGELEAGVVASVLGAPFAIVSGGIATVLLTGWIAWKYPRLRRYTRDSEPELAGH
jgi:MFS family permease